MDVEEDDTMTELTLTEKIPIAGKLSTSHISEGLFGMFTLIEKQSRVYGSGVYCVMMCFTGNLKWTYTINA